ncbi:MAG: sigma 54-interacting transcriptional regulator [Deltaproteobacteria bacterium]|nr:sigma 54-interacting transcriptional regulator [Deltaproteobacteria bacterium]
MKPRVCPLVGLPPDAPPRPLDAPRREDATGSTVAPSERLATEADVAVLRREAERLALAGDHEQAVAVLRRALTLVDDTAGEPLRLQLARSLGPLGRHAEAAELLRGDEASPEPANRLALAEALRLAGDLEGARELLVRCRTLDAGRAGAPVRERRRQEAECALLAGDLDGARLEAERLLGQAGLSGAERVRMLELLGRARLAASDWAGAAGRFAEARRGAAALGDSRQEVRACINEAICRLRLGATDEAARGFRDAAYLAAVLGLRREEAIAVENVAVLEHLRRRYGPALEHYRRALGLLDALGNPEYVARVAHNIGELLLRLGDPVGAGEQLEFAERVLAPCGAVPAAVRGESALLRARIELALGRTDGAATALETARAVYAELAEPERQAELTALEAERLAREGRHAEAHDLVRGRTPLLSRFPKHHAAALLVAADCLEARGSDPCASLERAAELARGLFDDELLWRAEFRLARHLVALRRLPDARRAVGAARKLEDRIRAAAPAEFAARMDRMPDRAALRALVRQLEAAPTVDAGAAAPRDADHGPLPLVAASPAFAGLLDRARRVARSGASVLLCGPTGSGKDRLARYVHEQSERAAGPFVKVSCGAAVEDLFLTDLLGHERGAFTGAVERRAGWFEAAAGGTLFLDELDQTSPRTQALILRVLEERRLVRVGGVEPVPIDVRVVCAASGPLDELVERGEFRAELYYHLRPMRLDVPALRERPEDVDAVARAVLERIGGGLRLTAEAQTLLRAQPWPGNVRELENLLVAAAALAPATELAPEDLRRAGLGGRAARAASPLARAAAETVAAGVDDVLAGRRSLDDLMTTLEGRVVGGALELAGGNLAAAARLVGLPRARFAQAARRLGLRTARANGKGEKP